MSTAATIEQTAPGDAPAERPSEGERYEIVDGERVELPAMSFLSSYVGYEIGRRIGNFALENDLGRGGAELLFRLPLPVDRQRRPDACFVSFERWPREAAIPETSNAMEVAPDLAVEVISPTDIADDIQDKMDEYFRAGVRLVWIVYPRHRRVWVFDSPTAVRIVAETETLEGGHVLPGFRLPLADLFLPRA